MIPTAVLLCFLPSRGCSYCSLFRDPRLDFRKMNECENIIIITCQSERRFLFLLCQGFDYACSVILKAAGNDESSSVELFKAWAAAAGRVVTDEKMRRKASNHCITVAVTSPSCFTKWPKLKLACLHCTRLSLHACTVPVRN